MNKKHIDYTGIEPETIDEYVSDIMADRGNAEGQIIENQKLIDETLDADKKYREVIQLATDERKVAKYEAFLKNSAELRELLKSRNVKLGKAIKVFDKVITRLRS